MFNSNTVWSTKTIDELLEKIKMGIAVDMQPFYNRDTELRNGNILFQLTKEEEEEFAKCANDINYFVSKYCKFLTDEGRKTVTLRPYQTKTLEVLGSEIWDDKIQDFVPENRNIIWCASRQIGKCLTHNNIVNINSTNNLTTLGSLYFKYSNKNIFNYVKKILYKISSKSLLKNFSNIVIQLLEKYEYRNLLLDENNISKKIIDTIDITDLNLSIDTPQGFKQITHIHKTQPYTIWKIHLENNLHLETADNHILFNQYNKQVFVKNLKKGSYIKTKFGFKRIINIEKSKFKQSMYDVTVNSNEHEFYSNDIVSHNTTTTAAFFAWYLCTHLSRNSLVLANKQTTAIEIVDKIMKVFRGLPFFLKPGVISAGALGMRLDNDCMLMSQATTKTASIGFTIHVLYMDEFAHIQQNIVRSFWRSVYPTLSSSKISQCIITSTPNGQDNLFFELWDRSIKKNNSFYNMRTDYWEVPEHDEAWAAKTKLDFGEEEFAQEFELKFDVTQDLLLSGSQLSFINKIKKKYNFHELYKSKLDDSLYKNLLWHPNFDPNQVYNNNDAFILSVDLGEGNEDNVTKDNDYNVANIFKIEPKSLAQLKKLRKDQYSIENMFRLRQVGIYRDNIKDEENCALVCKHLVFDVFEHERVLLNLEMNFHGKNFITHFSNHDEYYENIIIKTFHNKPSPDDLNPKKKMGFKVRNDKDHYCKQGKKLIGDKTIICSHDETYTEFAAFGKDKKGKYRGLGKHDDIPMTVLNLSRATEEEQYKDFLYDLLDKMTNTPEKQYINFLLEKEPYMENEISDGLFNSMYGESSGNELLEINKIFETSQRNNRVGGYSFGR